MSLAIVPIILSVLLAVVALVMLRRSVRLSRSEKIALVINPNQELEKLPPGLRSGLQRNLARAGVSAPLWTVYLALAFVALFLVLVYLTLGSWPSLLMFVFVSVLIPGVLRWRYHQRLRRMVQQLSGTLDHMIRSLKSGRTLSDAMLLAMSRCQNPLGSALEPAKRSIELGVPPGEALDEFADLYDQEELHVLAMGVRINQRYGGNASEMLGKLIIMIQDREKAGRQLRAMTGETRISAVVLASLPILVAGYIFISNKSFLMGLWIDTSGRLLLYLAVALQVVGCFLLWRMLRSL